jgi:hypothetical protein
MTMRKKLARRFRENAMPQSIPPGASRPASLDLRGRQAKIVAPFSVRLDHSPSHRVGTTL